MRTGAVAGRGNVVTIIGAEMSEDDPMSDPRRMEMTELMTPGMANFSGKVHGGALLNLLDRVAFSCASRYSGRSEISTNASSQSSLTCAGS